jgi:hypothetical protein
VTCLADKTNHPVKRLKSTAELLVGTLSACIQPEYWIQLPREQERGPGMPAFPKKMCWCVGPAQVSFICSKARRKCPSTVSSPPKCPSTDVSSPPKCPSFAASLGPPQVSLTVSGPPKCPFTVSVTFLITPHLTSPPHLLWHNFSLYPLNTCCHISPPELGKVPHSRGLCPNWADRVPTRPVSV